ncbi:GvpL/GvpF family gas vesicle protein [Streptomyces sp. NPDC006283]|uniref:GvpL/GvpF family gas vesicle protein n=1 Tax=Streptomyces sp. NPDC006283 TaxID=3156741 RepID=UPI0033BD1AD8
MNQLFYVYAVAQPVGDAASFAAAGVGDAPVRFVEHRGLAAVVSHVRAEDFEEAPLRAHLEDLDWLADTARAHESVVGAVSGITNLVPLRLATVCRDESGVRRLLDDGHDRFTSSLARLDGRVEWGVKLYAEPDAAPGPDTAPEPTAGPARTATATSGRDYLRRRLRSRQAREKSWARADASAQRLHAELARCAEAQRLHRPQSGQLAQGPGVNVLNAAFLVRREESAAFVGLFEQLAPQETGLRAELTGPWAPYSFADLHGPQQRESRQEREVSEERSET